jgi:hypothetical protein
MPNQVYQIVIKGNLDTTWSEWFDGWMIDHESNGNTIVTSPPIDQVALFSVLKKMNDLNLTFISMQRSQKISDIN